MSRQKKLSDFFTKPVPKSPLSTVGHDNKIECPQKRKAHEIETDEGEKFLQVSENDKKNKLDVENGIDDKVEPCTDHEKHQQQVSLFHSNGVNSDETKRELLELAETLPVLDTKMGPSWFKALKGEFKKPYFKKLSDFVTQERAKSEVYPPEDKVWSWTKECSVDNIKVVILGQDPYHNPGQAHGHCFSVPVGIPPPPSLINMYKELETDIEGFTVPTPRHGYLVGWARQGVLLLNACLTVRKNCPNSHKDRGWEDLTTAVIKYLNNHRTGIVFLLWGAYAQKKASFVDQKKHRILKTVHPSPLSASRGWFGCKHFSKCNDILKAYKQTFLPPPPIIRQDLAVIHTFFHP